MKYALIGKTLKHSYSKIIHEMLGEYEYDLVSLAEDEVFKFTKNGGYSGFNVTIPYKKKIIPYCAEISEDAEKIGSVNTVIRKENGLLYGYNTDYAGFRELAAYNGISFKGKRVAILGSGGTYSTVYAVVRDSGAEKIFSVSRSGEYNYKNIDEWSEVQVIINTTPVGMYPNNGEKLISLDDFHKCEAVLDVIYNPLKTKLIFDAEQRGLKCAGGLFMLIYQAKAASELFIGRQNAISAEDVLKQLEGEMTNIVLIGMPGSGKTTLGHMIADATGKELIDTDSVIEQRQGMIISEIFEKYGESVFRRMEKECIKEAGAGTGKIISCGGGAVLDEENHYPLSQNGKIIYVKRSIEKLAREGRPLSIDCAALYEMEIERGAKYAGFADAVIINDGTKEELLKQALEII